MLYYLVCGHKHFSGLQIRKLMATHCTNCCKHQISQIYKIRAILDALHSHPLGCSVTPELFLYFFLIFYLLSVLCIYLLPIHLCFFLHFLSILILFLSPSIRDICCNFCNFMKHLWFFVCHLLVTLFPVFLCHLFSLCPGFYFRSGMPTCRLQRVQARCILSSQTCQRSTTCIASALLLSCASSKELFKPRR